MRKAIITMVRVFYSYRFKLYGLPTKVLTVLTAIACCFCFYIQPAFCLAAEDIPEPLNNASYIVDLADILNPDIEDKLNAEIELLHQRKSKSIYLVTVDEVEQKPVQKLFKVVPPVSPSRRFLESILLNWNIDDLKHGNSILFLVSICDRSVEIRSGYNLKYIIRDRHIQGVIDKLIIPKLKQHDFTTAIFSGTEAIIKKIDNPYYSQLPSPESPVWESQIRLECESRNQINPRSGYSYPCPHNISYHGGSGTW